MRIALIFRNPEAGGHSIEGLFELLGESLAQYAEVTKIYWRGWRNLTAFLRAVRDAKAEIYHITGDVNYLIHFLPRRKCILTVHDIDHYRITLKGIRRFLYRVLWFDLVFPRAAALTVVSETTGQLVSQTFGVNKSNIHIIANWIAPEFRPIPKEQIGNPPVVLQVGTGRQKNLERLVQAAAGLKCRLVIIGRLNKEQQDILNKSGVDFMALSGLSRAELIEQYSQCDVVAFASLQEGFGLPIVEAQQIGRPVITSNRSPMRDVAGIGALLIDPENVGEYRNTLSRLFGDQELRAQVVADGLANAERFSLTNATMTYMKLYNQVSQAGTFETA